MSRSDYVAGHGDRRFAVRHYALDLNYNVTTNHLSGLAELTVEPLEDLRDVVLDLANLHVSKVTVDGSKMRHQHRGSRVKITPDAPLREGDHHLVQISYAGKPRPVRGVHGRVGWEELTDGVLVGSQPYGAPSWFPCNDRPDDKATYRIALTVPQAYHVAGNGVLVQQHTRSGRSTFCYEQREPMASYLACVQVGRYVTTAVQASGTSVPIEIVHPHGLDVGSGTAFARQGEMVTTFSELFGPYPFAAYRAVITEDDLEIPLEAQALSSFGANHVSPSWQNERLVAHELAHQWFGNSLTAARWRDIWLHEGFACYAEWLWSERSGGDSAETLAQRHYEALTRLPEDLLITDPGARSMFDDRIYKRGALTLHSLRKALGDNDFFAMLQDWTEQNAYRSVSTDQFRRHACTYADAPETIESLLAAWLDHSELPTRV